MLYLNLNPTFHQGIVVKVETFKFKTVVGKKNSTVLLTQSFLTSNSL